MPAPLDLSMQRDEDFARAFKLADDADAPIDISDWTIELQIRDPLNNSILIDEATITITDGAAGEFDLEIDGGPGSILVAYGNPLHTYALPYDLLVTDDNDTRMALIAGNLILSRGVNQ